jgi:hypothetical protein
MGGACRICGKNAYTRSSGSSEGKWPFGRTRRGWEYNVEMDLKGIRFDGVEGIHLARDEENGRSVVNTAMDLGIPGKDENFSTN